ncbi:MAG: RluA family pseudouridine synthase [Syntrophales bacterium]|nr:RluA family pseudouridine synthase [Syntrophales bacterium]
MNLTPGEGKVFTVTDCDAGTRVDIFLSRKAKTLSRAAIIRAIREGKVSIDGRVVKPSRRLKAGEAVFVMPLEVRPCELVPENIPIKILYEDPYMMVVNKPPGMVVHPGAGNSSGTLVNALLYHCRDLSGIGGVLRPGIVHRLDKDTSGVLVVAKTDEAHEGLAKQFRDRRVKKVYYALVYGDMEKDEGLVDLPIGRHPVKRRFMSVRISHGKEAITRWKVIERFGCCTLLSVETLTGRTHQIRVHLKAIGHPIVGDQVYGSRRKVVFYGDRVTQEHLLKMKRQALHASMISIVHPISKHTMDFVAPLPDDMGDLLVFLRMKKDSLSDVS